MIAVENDGDGDGDGDGRIGQGVPNVMIENELTLRS